MVEPYEIKKAKIDALIKGFNTLGYKPTNRIGQTELLQFLNKRSSSGQFDLVLSEKLFQVLNLDTMSTMFVEDFINGYLKFEEDIKKNAELFNIKLNQEQEIYAKIAEQCRKYKAEKLNEEGMCENAKVYGEITDIDIKKKLEGIKEIIIKVIYNEKSEELHFKIGDLNSDEMKNKSFGFKPTSRKDHFEFIMKGVNDRNQIFDIGSKVFPLTEVTSHEEYIVQIVIPEIDNEEETAAFIHAKIVLYWSDYKFYEKQKRKAESRLKKLTSAANKAALFLKYVRQIYGDLTRKKPDLIVDFNNEKLMQRKGAKLNVHFNNTKEAKGQGGKFLVEFNNVKEIKRTTQPIKVEFNNTKEIIVEEKKETEDIPINKEEEQVVVKATEVHTNVEPVEEPVFQVEEEKVQENNEYVEEGQENINNEYNLPQEEFNTGYGEQMENGGAEYNYGEEYYNNEMVTTTTTTTNQIMNNYSENQQGNNGLTMAETIGYGTSDIMGNTEAYGTGGTEMIDDNTNAQYTDIQDFLKENETDASVGKSFVNSVTKKTLFTTSTLPVKIMETKVNETIFDDKVNSLPMIYGGNRVTYASQEEANNYNFNNFYSGIGNGNYNQEYSYNYEFNTYTNY